MRRLNFIIILFSFPAIISCSKKDTITPEEGKQSVYVAGFEVIDDKSMATVWKDGVATHLNDGIAKYGEAMSVFVKDKDVYVAGQTRPKTGPGSTATLWVNNTPRPLAFSGESSRASTVYVSGNDVYVGGYEVSGNTSTSIIWKNGVREALDADGYSTTLYDIFVSGGDVYAVGGVVEETEKGKIQIAAYWKNGVLTKLTEGKTNACAYSIFVEGNNVYIAGDEYKARNVVERILTPMLWVNGTGTILPVGNGGIANARGVFVDGKDVYVVGNQVPLGAVRSMATMWKNSNEFSKCDQSLESVVGKVYVSGGEVFATGNIVTDADGRDSHAALWKNEMNQSDMLRTTGSNYSVAYDVFVTNGKK